MAEKYCDKPRLCEALGVEVNEEFEIDGYYSIRNFRVDEKGNLVTSPASDSLVLDALITAISDPDYYVIHVPKWMPDDIEDAKAVRRIFPEVTHIVKQGGTVNFGYFPDKEVCGDEADNEAFKDTEAVTMSIPETAKLFVSVKVGEKVKLDDILGQEAEA